jgi:hypothetical protein
MWVTLGIAGVLALAAVIYLASLNGRYRVRRSLEIDAAVGAVFDAIVDFKSWPYWSPWLLHEPDAAIVYSENHRDEGGNYSWEGKRIGAGKLTHVAIRPVSHINQQIAFLRPFKSVSQVNWAFENRGDKTMVSWEMTGKMPFLFRFMARRMEPMIGRDYDLGLALLNGYLNELAPHPSVAFIGEQELEDFSYWAIPCNGNLRQLEAARASSIEALTTAAAGKTGLPLTLYHRFDPQASQFHAEIAIPVTDSAPPSNYRRREFSGGRYYQLTLRGDHRFIPLGWHALASHCRLHRIRRDPSRPALEIYHDDPASVSDGNQIRTALYLAIR